MLLRPDNFTPPARTPWGGRRIVDVLKAAESLEVVGPVGESWELSVEPDFPSRLAAGPRLDEVLAANPHVLGREASVGSTALLVKLIDAADDLSLQIHPEDDDPALAPDESGKPEAWYVVDAAPGAGLYLGFRDGVSRSDVRDALAQGEAVDAMMTFVEVSPGDVFVIEPGTPHAIGRGVLLLEPQRVSPGKRGVTYRYWDWNRRYDSAGQPDPEGAPRQLHVERALDVTRWSGETGDLLLRKIHLAAGAAGVEQTATLETLVSPSGPLRSEVFAVQRASGTGALTLPAHDGLRALTVLQGRVVLEEDDARLTVERGRTVALPAGKQSSSIELEGAHAVLCGLA